MADSNTSSEDKRRRVEEVRGAIRQKDWALARGICDDDWTELRAQIDRGERASAASSRTVHLLDLNGFILVFEGARPFDREPNMAGDLSGPGTMRSYAVSGPGETMLLVETFELDDAMDDVPVWVTCRDAFQSASEFQRLTSGMRLGSKRLVGGGRSYDVGMARFGTGAKRGSSVNKVGLVELNEITKADVEAIVKRFGATRFGLRSDVLADTSQRKNYLCAVDDSGEATDLGVVIYFLTRVLPIARRLGLDGVHRGSTA